MKRILSIQSHVAYGYVGNRAAVFPLQCMGFDVTTINTVQFSNHPGYGQWTGDVFSPKHIKSIIGGLRDLGVLYSFDAVLSGYLGDREIGRVVLEAVAEIKTHNPDCLYCCDPVMGDVGRGLFVKPDIPPLFRDTACKQADILTPNLFELEQLTGCTIHSLTDAQTACSRLHTHNTNTVLVTSLVHKDTLAGHIQMLATQKHGRSYLITTPYLNLTPMPNGTGDLTAALFTGYILGGHTLKDALEMTGSAVFTVLSSSQGREINIIENKNIFTDSWINDKKTSFLATRID